MSLQPPDTAAPEPGAEQQALQDALAGLLAQVARLSVAQGLPCAAVEETLRSAFVQAASQAHPGLAEHRKVSRISTTTGLHRREVSRLLAAKPRATSRTRSPASELFTHWRTDPAYRDRDGQPLALPRLGPVPSFESLAQAVTRDVHPRSLLDELRRLGLLQWDEQADTVSLVREVFVPQGNRLEQLGFLGDNLADHLRAAVDNVLLGPSQHMEQAVFADGLSAASIEALRPAIRAQWQALLTALVPLLEARVAQDAVREPAPQGRLRVGLYSYQETPDAPPPAAEPLQRVIKRKK